MGRLVFWLLVLSVIGTWVGFLIMLAFFAVLAYLSFVVTVWLVRVAVLLVQRYRGSHHGVIRYTV